MGATGDGLAEAAGNGPEGAVADVPAGLSGAVPEAAHEAASRAAPADAGGLSERDRAVLAMERRSWSGPGAKERAVRERLGLSPVRYYQLLNALLDDERALACDPVTVNRLRRLRDSRRGQR
ncbi:DUF3263 domain-containing protein [Streptomyces sp. HNM0663]|uniref:DUF3263 domain-containing protein n=1 Tax=Streptomyces chengmaiensis TaxID=3040919 RepID=A0ABT6HLS5_9ACTN|nr:DUF3263 domain-containing protein [Streptomyces chengmaiensis]MDH2389681.1 DUF3263 domain-containing protein [Streptomyces chengmaiensis]